MSASREDGLSSLSRELDHIGNLRRILSELSGYSTLAHELIQNADDAQAKSLKFEIRPDALVVWNDSEFSNCRRLEDSDCPWLATEEHRCDFHSFRLIGSGDKQNRQGTTGAFGIGFTAVYRITDRPELISSDQWWVIDEMAESSRRISRSAAPSVHVGTTFRLPWAFEENSVFRIAVNQPAVAKNYPTKFAHELTAVVLESMLFLQHLESITVVVGDDSRSFERRQDGSVVSLRSPDGQLQTWHLLSGEFDLVAAELREQYEDYIDQYRSSKVTVAVSSDLHGPGRLYVTLPTDEPIRLSLHVNADFYPKADRQSVLLERSPSATVVHQVDWNRAALSAAARTLANSLELLGPIIGFEAVWRMILAAQSVDKIVETGELDPVFGTFWQAICSTIQNSKIVPTASGKVVSPVEVFIPRAEEEINNADSLEAIGVNVVDRPLRDLCYQARSEATGLRELTLARLCDALIGADFDRARGSSELPEEHTSRQFLDGLLAESAILYFRDSAGPDPKRRFALTATAPTLNGGLGIWSEIRSIDWSIFELVEDVLSDRVQFIDDGRVREAGAEALVDIVPAFSVSDLVEAFESIDGVELSAALSQDRMTPRKVLRWIMDREVGSKDLDGRLAALPLFPSASGLHPLSELMISGDFEDPLGLASVADAEQIGELVPFLRRLGARTLTFDTFVHQAIPDYFSKGEPDLVRTRQLVRLLAQRLGNLLADSSLVEVLRVQPIIECTDGQFRSPDEVFVENDLNVAVLADDVWYVAEPNDAAVSGLLRTLGVRDRPSADAVLRRCRVISGGPVSDHSKFAIVPILDFLTELIAADSDLDLREFAGFAWLPLEGDLNNWHHPAELDLVFQRYLHETSGSFLDLPLEIQQRTSRALSALGCRSTPTVEAVVQHVLTSIDGGRSLNRDVYRFLNEHSSEPALGELKGSKCLLLSDGTFVAPSEVYWSDHYFGRYRFSLDSDFLKYQSLLNRLGVRQRPEPIDAVAVLRDVARDYHVNAEFRTDSDLAVTILCWQHLSEALETGFLSDSDLQELSSIAAIPNLQSRLQLPADVLFDDWPGLASQFDDRLARNFIKRTSGSWKAMSAVGVRTLTSAIETEFIDVKNSERDEETREWIVGREAYLRRVIESFGSEARRSLDDFMVRLEVLRCDEVLIQRLVELRDRKYSTETHSVEAVLLDGVLRLQMTRGRVPWSSVAREIERHLVPEAEPGVLSPTILVILRETDKDALDQELDQLGIPRLQSIGTSSPESARATGFGGTDYFEVETDDGALDRDMELGGDLEVEDEEVQRPDASFIESDEAMQNRGSGGQPRDIGLPRRYGSVSDLQPNSGPDLERQRGSVDEPRSRSLPGPQPKERKARGSSDFVGKSFVRPDRSTADDEIGQTASRADTERAAVEAAMKYEIDAGRIPREMPPNNPGFDIESSSAAGDVERYIEVKGLSVTWGQDAVQLTPREHQEANVRRDQYWIYVVDDARNPDLAVLHAIQDPVSKISRYVFDDGWLEVASDQWQPLPSLPIVDLRDQPGDGRIPFYNLEIGPPGSGRPPDGWVEDEHVGDEEEWFAVQLLDRAAGAETFGAVAYVEPLIEGEYTEGELLLLDIRNLSRLLPCSGVTSAMLWREIDNDGAETFVIDLGPLGQAPLTSIEVATIGILGFVHLPRVHEVA
jgi:hypothetical protein